MDTWARHLPVTSEVLLPLVFRAASGCTDFSTSERILYTTCEFRSAMAARALASHLGGDVVRNLRNAAIAFQVIGARQVASLLHAAVEYLGTSPMPQQIRSCVRWLDGELAKSQDRLDELIARHAAAMKDAN